MGYYKDYNDDEIDENIDKVDTDFSLSETIVNMTDTEFEEFIKHSIQFDMNISKTLMLNPLIIKKINKLYKNLNFLLNKSDIEHKIKINNYGISDTYIGIEVVLDSFRFCIDSDDFEKIKSFLDFNIIETIEISQLTNNRIGIGFTIKDAFIEISDTTLDE